MDFDAEKYNKSNRLQIRDAKDLIHRIGAENSDKNYDIVLDIGCGTGNITLMLSNSLNVKHIYAIDVDEEMIAFAKQNHMKDNISYFVQDFGQEFDQLSTELRALEGKVSLIFSNHCLHWIKEKKNVVKNLHRLLSKGGKIYTNIYWISNLFGDMSADEKAIYEKELIIPEREAQMDVWMTLFKAQGFNVISHQFFLKDCDYEKDFFIEHLLPLSLTIRRIYFVGKGFTKDNEISKLIEAKVMTRCRHYVDESTGEDMIEFKYGFFQFVLKS